MVKRQSEEATRASLERPDVSLELSLTELKTPYLPDTEEFVSAYVTAASSLLASSDDWPSGKKPKQMGGVRTRSQPKKQRQDGIGWHLRESFHSEPYEWFKNGLLVDHSRHEAEYIESCAKAEQVKVIDEGVAEIWNMLYKMPFAVTNRDFAVLIVTKETTPSDSPLRSFLVISIPAVHPPNKGYVRAKYVSVEEVREVYAGESGLATAPAAPGGAAADGERAKLVRWRMAVRSTAAGMIPTAMSEFAMPGKISEDVPSFLTWAKAKHA